MGAMGARGKQGDPGAAGQAGTPGPPGPQGPPAGAQASTPAAYGAPTGTLGQPGNKGYLLSKLVERLANCVFSVPN